jgi:PUA domain protein
MHVKRFVLRGKETKIILRQIKEGFGVSLESAKVKVEVVKSGDLTMYLIDGSPVLMEKEGRLLPTLFFQKLLEDLPAIVVDMGAIPAICRGADVMAPGIRRVEGDFEGGSFVKVVDEVHGKAIALGISLLSSKEIEGQRSGKVVEVFHFVGDKVWNLAKTVKPIS